MAQSPMIILAIIVGSLVFQAALFGGEYASDSFGEIGEISEECNGDGFFDGIQCFISKVVNFFKIIGGIIVFFWKFITFDVPGAPWYIRAILTTLLTGGLLWSVATLFRGN